MSALRYFAMSKICHAYMLFISFGSDLKLKLNVNQTPLLLDVNTKETKLREVIDKIIKSKLGMNLPLVMIGSTLVFEDGDGLEEDEAANYALNLDKVLSL
jgi:hypothetical protein